MTLIIKAENNRGKWKVIIHHFIRLAVIRFDAEIIVNNGGK